MAIKTTNSGTLFPGLRLHRIALTRQELEHITRIAYTEQRANHMRKPLKILVVCRKDLHGSVTWYFDPRKRSPSYVHIVKQVAATLQDAADETAIKTKGL